MKHLNLQPGEQVAGYARQHWVKVAVPLFFEIGLILLAFFLMTPLIRFGPFGIVVFAAMSGAGAFLAFRSWLLWHSNVFVITNRRIVDIDRRGFFHWVVSEAKFVNINDISWNQKGMLETMFGAGDVVVQTASGFVNLEIRFVKDPAHVSQCIKDARDEGEKEVADVTKVADVAEEGLDEDGRRALARYAEHLRSKKAYKEFMDSDDEKQ